MPKFVVAAKQRGEAILPGGLCKRIIKMAQVVSSDDAIKTSI
jgi:hypothetical protein